MPAWHQSECDWQSLENQAGSTGRVQTKAKHHRENHQPGH